MPFGTHEMGCGSTKVAQSSTTHGDSRSNRGREDTENSRQGHSRNSSSYYTGSAGTSRQSNKGSLFKQSVSENDFSTVTSISGTSRIRVTLSNDGSLLEVETEKLDEGYGYQAGPHVDYSGGGGGGGAQGHTAFGRERNLRGAEGGSGATATGIDVTGGSLRPYSSCDGNRQAIHASLPNLQYGCNGANTLSTGSSCTCSCSCPDSDDSNGKEDSNTRSHSTGLQGAFPEVSTNPQRPARRHYYHTIRPYCQPHSEHRPGQAQPVCRHKTDVSSASPTAESTAEATSAEATRGTFNSQRTSSRKAKQSIVSVMSSNNSSCQATQALCVCCSGISQSPLGPSALSKTYDVNSNTEVSFGTALSDKATSKANHVDAKIHSNSSIGNYTNRCDCQALTPHSIHGDHECNCECHVRDYRVVTTSGATYRSSSPNSLRSESPDMKYQLLLSDEDGSVKVSENSYRSNGDKCPPTPTHHSCYRNTTATYCGYGTKRCHYGDSDISQAHEHLLGENGEDLGINQNQDMPGLQLGYYHDGNVVAASNHKGEGSDDFTSKFQVCHNESSCRSCASCQCTSHYPLRIPVDIQRPNSGDNQGHFSHTETSIGLKSPNLRDSHHKQCHHSCNHNYYCSAISPLAEAGAPSESCSIDDHCHSPYGAVGMEQGFACHNPKTCMSCLRSLNKVSCQSEEEYSNSGDPGQYDVLLPNNSNNTFINSMSNVPNSIQTNTIVVKPEIHNYDNSGFSSSDTVDGKSQETKCEIVANVSPLPSNGYKPSITTSTSVNGFPYHDYSTQDKSTTKEGQTRKIVRSQSYTMSTLKEERLLDRNDIIVKAQIEKPPRGLLGGNKRSISIHSSSITKGSSGKSLLQNGIGNGISGLSNIPPGKTGSKFRSRAPILKKGSKSESMGSSTDSSIAGNGEGPVSTNSSTVDSGLGAEVPIDGMLDLDVMYLTVHQDFFNGKYPAVVDGPLVFMALLRPITTDTTFVLQTIYGAKIPLFSITTSIISIILSANNIINKLGNVRNGCECCSTGLFT